MNFIPEVEQIVNQLERGTVVTKFYLRKPPQKRNLSIRRETRQIIWHRSGAGSQNSVSNNPAAAAAVAAAGLPTPNESTRSLERSSHHHHHERNNSSSSTCSVNSTAAGVHNNNGSSSNNSSSSRNVTEGAVDIREIKLVRQGKSSKDFERWPDEHKRHDASKCVVVFYGNEFRLRTLSVAALSEKEADMWVRGLNFLVNDTASIPYPMNLNMWLRKEFYAMENSRGKITLKELKSFLPRVNCKMATNRLRECFNSVDTRKCGEIGFDDFAGLFHDQLVYDRSLFDEYFGGYKGDDGNVSAAEFERFLRVEQREEVVDVCAVIREYLQDPLRDVQSPCLTVPEFLDYLYSKQNEIWDSRNSFVNQDMSRPLSHYWIASSHNTYLTGDQFSSESSVDAYTRCLLQGCRCVELDCWDGPDGTPFIFHGHTLTTKIKFVDVLKAIKEHAFTSSEYPVVLSLEDHCTLPQQRKMAQKFTEIFGETLVTQSLDKHESRLPSPEQLKRRIILKHKKLPENNGAVEEGGSVKALPDDVSKEMDLSNTIKNGVMWLKDDSGVEWVPHFFVLTTTHLLYTEMTSEDEMMDDGASVADDDGNPATGGNKTAEDELHFSEKWFHGRLKGGRTAANELIQHHAASLGEGCFLVRESENFVGDFTISFWRNGRVHHAHIHSKYEWGLVKYYLVDNLTFDSLYTLITHYRSSPIKGLEFHVKLGEPVPQPQSHEGKHWFHAGMDRAGAEMLLRRVPVDGAYLVRSAANHSEARYAISFRFQRAIKHCVIKEEGRLFLIGGNKFESLVELVAHYEVYPFYKKTRLTQGVNEDVVSCMGSSAGDEDVYVHTEYLDTNMLCQGGSGARGLRVRALYEYKARRDDELSFQKGDIICGVVKEDEGWWKGSLSIHADGAGLMVQGWFPGNYVVELEEAEEEELYNDQQHQSQQLDNDSTPLGSLQKGSVEMTLGAYVELTRGTHESMMGYVIKIYTDHERGSPSITLGLKLEQECEAKEWCEAIRETALHASEKESKNKKIENKNKIAKELSSLIVYCCSVNKFNLERVRSRGKVFYEMYSFPETAAEKLMCGLDKPFFLHHHQEQLSRVYPKGQRLDSSNYNPVPLWNTGCQMVALNYQTPDKPMQLNQGKFRQNGGCGYVLRPEFMFASEEEFASGGSASEPIIVNMVVLGARHLSKSGRGIVSPFVEIELISNVSSEVRKTKTVGDNGLNPYWNESFEFEVHYPELAMMRLVVQDEDVFGDPNFIGQACYPVGCLREGYRSVPLMNGWSEELELSSLLVHVSVKRGPNFL